MDKQITEKLEVLLKYVPFIDFVVDIDKEKYVKFVDIKKWIIKKRRYPLSDLQKIERSIITQYKNMLVVDAKKIPPEIIKIFCNDFKHQYIDLCSDEEDNNKKTRQKRKEASKRSHVSETTSLDIDSDDDLEIVSISYPVKQKKECNSKPSVKKDGGVDKKGLDEMSVELLEQIDQFSADDKKKSKYVEPPNYHENSDNDEELFQRRTPILFKRRDDFEQGTAQNGTTENKNENKSSKTSEGNRRHRVISTSTVVNTISLDSSDDETPAATMDIGKGNDELVKGSAVNRGLDDTQQTSVGEKSIVDTNNSKLLFTRLSEDRVAKPDPSGAVSDAISSKRVANDANAECSLNNVENVTSPEIISNERRNRLNNLVEEVEKSKNVDEKPSSVRKNSQNNVVKEVENSKNSAKNITSAEKTSNEPKNSQNNVVKVIENSKNSAKIATSAEKTSNEPINSLNNVVKEVENSKNYTENATSAEKAGNERKNPSPVKCVDLSSLDNFNIEQLLSCIIRIDESKNPDLESLLLKTILRRLRSSSSEEQGHTPEITTTFNNLQSEYSATPVLPATSAPAKPGPLVHHQQQPIPYLNPHTQQPQPISPLYQHPYGYQQPITPYNKALFAPVQVMPIQRKLNLNDPRIRNFLNKFKNSPLLTPQEREMAANLGENGMPQFCNVGQGFISPAVVHHASLHNNAHVASHSVPSPVQNIRMTCIPQNQIQNKCRTPGTLTVQNSISFAEYKRRKTDELLRVEKLREDERKRQEDDLKRQEDERRRQHVLDDIEKRDTQKKTEEIRSILLNTLQPYEGKIASMWELQKKPNDNSTSSKKEDEHHNKTRAPKSHAIKSPGKKETSKEAKEAKSKIDRVNRAIKGLECTFKGYDQIQDYIPKAIGGRRRSSVNARTAIAEQLLSLDDTDISSSQSTNESCESSKSNRRRTIDASTKSLEGKRPSSVQARTAIAKQLNDQPDEAIPSSSPCTPKRRKTTDAVTKSLEEKRRSSLHDRTSIAEQLNDEPDDDTAFYRILTPKRVRVNRIIDDDVSNDCLSNIQRTGEEITQKQLRLVLKRLTVEEIKEHTKRNGKIKSNNILNVHLVESRSRPGAVDVASKTPSVVKKVAIKRLNNDCEMTESNTKVCILCGSKPSDLTAHYTRKHKSESYVSRLTWSQLDELCINTPFAKAVTNTNSRVTRYSVKCPFCDDELIEPFMNLYNHYSTHTGEYAFQCSGCQLEKPFRADILSHQLHSKTCRGSHVQTMYRYPSNAMVIYLHYCTICNFVQLNEANILRHLRDHHDQRQSTPNNVQKCILVAISDGPPDASNNESLQTNSSNESHDQNLLNGTETIQKAEPRSKDDTKDVVVNEIDSNDYDDIPVRNEACAEELYESATCPLDEQLKQMHAEPVVKTTRLPMTVVHFNPTSSNTVTAMKSPGFASIHVPKVFKNEPIDIGEKRLITPPRPILEKIAKHHRSSKSTYRSYPSNVKYLGLYKCVADDCYYSTDSPSELLRHLEDHSRVNISGEYLQCAYCSILEGTCTSSQQLVDHIQKHHLDMIYQCSMCCYRSCEASNVSVHQKVNHAHTYRTCTIYKCSGSERSFDANYLNVKIAENVRKLQCSYCRHKSFYHSNLLEDHIKTEHNVQIKEKLKSYSCIYCPLTSKDGGVIRKHVALEHPEEQPYQCDHNNSVSTTTDDILHNMKPFNLSQPMTVTEVSATLDSVTAEGPEDPVVDLKPNADELLKFQEETVKVRLRKLTEKSGVAPDSLYHCPEQTCGGFFSNYDLWLRHMRVKHHCLECQCPHCPTQTTRTLLDYKVHFEEHRRHTYICFHCPLKFANYQDVMDHGSRDHFALGSMRFEQLSFNLSYSYFVQIQTELLTNRSEFMPALLNCLDNRLKEQETNESKSLKSSWLVPTDTATWLEHYPNDICRKLKKKCFVGSCDFRATEAEVLFKHVRENHNIVGSTFNCCQCDFHLENCRQWDDVLNHIQQHSDISFFICGACFNYHYSRSKLANHIREEHAARDVPIINLNKKRRLTYLSLAMVFANECLTFSTMRNCFCCEERNMKGDAFILHLKRYHRLVLNYFCEWCNLPIETLQAAEEHFRTVHTRNRFKIRCEFASKCDVFVMSVRNFRVHINTGKADEHKTPLVAVKPELGDNLHNDDSVILLEDEDIVVEKYVRDQKKTKGKFEKPKLKCIAMTNLVNSPPGDSEADQVVNRELSCEQRALRVFPRIKIVPARQPCSSVGSNTLISRSSSGFSHQQVPVTSDPTNAMISSFPTQQASSRCPNVVPPSNSNQFGATSSVALTVPLRTTVIQCLPNERFTHSHSQVINMPASNMERPIQHMNYPTHPPQNIPTQHMNYHTHPPQHIATQHVLPHSNVPNSNKH